MPERIRYHRQAGPAASARAYQRQQGRMEDNRFYASARWRKLRAYKLSLNPLCEKCQREGRVTQARHVHHVEERKDRPDLAYELSNLESLCVPCHGTMRGKHGD